MEMGGELLSWIIGIGLVVALLGGAAQSSRKRRRRRHHSRGRKSSVRRFDRQRDVTDRRGGSGRFPRAALPGRVVRIIDGDGLVAEVPGFGRLNVRLAYPRAAPHRKPAGVRASALCPAVSGPASVTRRGHSRNRAEVHRRPARDWRRRLAHLRRSSPDATGASRGAAHDLRIQDVHGPPGARDGSLARGRGGGCALRRGPRAPLRGTMPKQADHPARLARIPAVRGAAGGPVEGTPVSARGLWRSRWLSRRQGTKPWAWTPWTTWRCLLTSLSEPCSETIVPGSMTTRPGGALR